MVELCSSVSDYTSTTEIIAARALSNSVSARRHFKKSRAGRCIGCRARSTGGETRTKLGKYCYKRVLIYCRLRKVVEGKRKIRKGISPSLCICNAELYESCRY